MRRARRGFTLVELLVVLGLLGAFSYMAFRLLSGGLTVWKITEESRDQDERARAVLEMMRRDLAQVDSGPYARFVVDYGAVAISAAPVTGTAGAASKSAAPKTAVSSSDLIRLRFTRSIGAVEESRIVSGLAVSTAPLPPNETRADATRADSLAATIGLAEVAYAALDDKAADDPALQVVRRAVVPVRADDSSVSVFAKDYFTRRDGFESTSAVIAGGVLHLGLELVSQRPDVVERAWDSTRGDFITPAMTDPNRFSLSLAEPPPIRDRVFPRRVRATLILEREEKDRRVVRLANPIEAGDRELALDDPRPLPIEAGELVKIGTEWMRAASAGPRVLRVQARGALGTRATSHAAGAALHRGRTFIIDIPIATYRDADLR